MSFTPGTGAVISFSVEGAQTAQRQIESIGASMQGLSSTAKSSLKDLAAFAGVGLSLGALSEKVLGAQREFDKLNASLITATGSVADAATAFKSLQAFAASTPYSVADATEAFIKMKNLGLDPSEKALRSYGNTAAAMGKGLDQMIEAVADAATGEFERLKEFGITSKQTGDKVSLTFKGMTTTIGKNADEIQAYLKKLGDTDFAGAMAMRADTLDGAISNLGDAWDAFLLKMSQSGLGDAAKTGVVILADNLQLLSGVIGTVAAAKLGSTFAAWAVETYKQVTASIALRAATVAEMEAEVAGTAAKVGQLEATQAMVVIAREEAMAKLASSNANIAAAETAIAAAEAAGAQSFALRSVRLATAELTTAEAARAAMLAELAVLGQQQERLSAQLTAARLAEKAAQDALNTSTGTGTLATGVATRALGLLSGPVGAIITVLGLAATAWSVWGRSAQDSSKQAAESYEEAHKRIVKGLDEQIAKNQKLIQLQNLGMTKPQIDRNQPVLEQLAAASKRLEAINNRTGDYAEGAGKSNTDVLFDRMKVMQQIVELTAKMKKGDELAALAATGSTEAMIAVRERLTGVNQQYMDDLEKLQAAYDKGEVKLPEYTAAVSKLATETFKNSTAGKDSAEAIDANIAAMKRRDQVADVLTQRELARIAAERDIGGLNEVDAINETAAAELAAFDRKAGLIAGEMVLTKQKVGTAMELAAKQSDLEGQLAEVGAQRRNRQLQQMYELAAIGAKVQSEVTKYIADSTAARDEASASLDVEYALYGKTADARAMAMVAVDAETWKEKQLAKLREEKKPVTDQILTQLDAERRARIAVGEATLGQGKALQYASELAEENKRFGLEYISDDKQRAAAQLAIDADLWRERIRLAGEGTEAQKLLQQEYSTWYQNQLLKPELDATKKMWESVEQTAHDTFISIFDSGKSAFDRLRDALKNGLLDLLYQMTVKKWIINIGASVGMSSAAGLAQAATGGTGDVFASAAVSGGNPLMQAVGAASTMYKSLSGGLAGIGNSIASGLGQGIEYLGGQFGSSAATTFGQGMQGFGADGSLGGLSGAGSTAGSIVGQIGGTVGGYMAGSALNSMISGKYETGSGVMTAEKIATAVASYINPVAGAVVGAISGLINRAFGMGPTELAGSGLRGTLAASGTTGETYQNLHQDGGWFRSDKNWTDTKALTTEMSSQLTQAFGALKLASGSFAQSLGVGTDALADYTKAFDITFTSDAAKNQQAIADFFVGVGDELAKMLVPSLDQFSRAGESAAATLERLAGDFKGTDQVAQLLGFSASTLFGSAGLDSAKAREQLIDMAGGLSALSSQAAFFNQNFLTDAERLKPVSEALDKALASLGLNTIPATRDEFKGLINSLIVSGAVATESGAKQLDSLLALAEAFAQVHPQIDAAAEAAERAATALQAVKDSASTMLAGVNDAFSVLQKVVSREKSAIQSSVDTHTAAFNKLQSLSQALHSTLDSLQSPDEKTFGRTAAQAQIRAALAIAKAGGSLPDSESLKNALSAVTQDASGQFSNYVDYVRDMAQTKSDIAQLAGLTDDSLSVEQRSLDALKDQLTRLDDIVANGQAQLDALNGQSVATLSLAQAMTALQSSIAAAQTNPIVAGTSSVASLYQELLGRAPDQAGLKYWQDVLASGASLENIRNVFMGSDEYKKLHPFAVGTNFVPETMPALVHQGERIIPAADNRLLMQRLSNPGENNAALAAELKALREEVKGLRAEARATAGHTEKTSRLLNRVIREDRFVVGTEEDA